MANPWDATFDRIRAQRRVGEVYSAGPSDAEFDAVSPGRPLPPSYHAFALRFGLDGWLPFGPGEWSRRAHLLPLVRPSEAARLHGARGTVAGETTFLNRSADALGGMFADLIARCVCFGFWGMRIEAAPKVYVWDPAGATADGEWPVYEIERVDRSGRLAVSHALWFASAFDRFVRRIAAGPPRSEPDAILYHPRPQRHRHKPGRLNAEKWLTFDDHTARLIAKSIRDEGRADAFPILADALQDAGCAHPDLLDACRTGDPDIDGRWVLEVLLGS